MGFRTLDDADVKSKRVLVRVDLNVPMADGQVTDLTRIERIVPTIAELSKKGAKVILLAHFGRPKGVASDENSLKHVVKPLAKVLGHGVHFAEDSIGDKAKTAVDALKDGDVLLLENTRFHKGEEKNDPEFVKALAANGDLYVNDAFSAAAWPTPSSRLRATMSASRSANMISPIRRVKSWPRPKPQSAPSSCRSMRLWVGILPPTRQTRPMASMLCQATA
jgi:3-phosphoglycerate kinase